MSFIGYNLQKDECSVSIHSDYGPNKFGYIKKEFEYIDFLIDLDQLSEILKVKGHFLGIFTKRKYGEEIKEQIKRFVPETKSSEVLLYYQPIGANMNANGSVVCDIFCENDKIIWRNFGFPNPAWIDPIDFISEITFDKAQYIETFQMLLCELINYKTPDEIDLLWRKKNGDELPF